MKQLRNRARRIDGLFSFSAHASPGGMCDVLDMLPAVGVHACVGGAHAVNCRFFRHSIRVWLLAAEKAVWK